MVIIMDYIQRIGMIKQILEQVDEIGKVVEYQLYDTFSNVLNKLTTDKKVNGWVVHRDDMDVNFADYPTLEHEETYTISGFYSMTNQGASSLEFQCLCDRICSQINTHEYSFVELTKPASIEDIDTEMIAGTLYHNCLISLQIKYER